MKCFKEMMKYLSYETIIPHHPALFCFSPIGTAAVLQLRRVWKSGISTWKIATLQGSQWMRLSSALCWIMQWLNILWLWIHGSREDWQGFCGYMMVRNRGRPSSTVCFPSCLCSRRQRTWSCVWTDETNICQSAKNSQLVDHQRILVNLICHNSCLLFLKWLSVENEANG